MKTTPLSLSRVALGVVATGLILAGCSKSDNTPSASSPASDKKTITVGFAQTGAESGWRTANTESLKSEAAKRGINLKITFANNVLDTEIASVRDFITQKVDAIVIAPTVKDGWDQVLKEAKDAKIPVILEDRSMSADPSLYAGFIGSDFMTEGHKAAAWLIKATGGKGRIVELSGHLGSDAADDRQKAFAEGIANSPGLTIIDSQTGDFQRDQGKQVMEALLKKHPAGTFDILYAHNDDMALGAMQAIEEAGLKPGKDIMIISLDGEKEALQAIVDGKINCVVECNPMTGPLVFDAVEKVLAGQKIPPVTYNTDQVFDLTNAADVLKQPRSY
jgi:simple sugar transport system substrate-binding protein